MSKKQTSGKFMFVWGAPLTLGVLSVFGLLSALLGTGAWHWASWASLAILLLVIARYGFFPPRQAK
ncbi:hypothetical protein [Achromobacter sp. Marseille-Q4962]|uniref:hypothetical protein n=1 Tax=Achromobacter sp. Marseille-Q4962 TaxID=2942202 RepID=UPI002073F79E|nr:hypothetical protein [Achromobacter sp. Marseille-Q4962]